MVSPKEPATASRPLSPDHQAFTDWFRENFTKLCADLMGIGVAYDEAQDSAAFAAEQLLLRWHTVAYPYAYARKTAFRTIVKSRIRDRQVFQSQVRQAIVAVASEDPGLTVWEDRQWVAGLLQDLPPRQREVMALIVDELEPREAAELLGRTADAVRCALVAARKRLKDDLAVSHQDAARAANARPRRSEESQVDQR